MPGNHGEVSLNEQNDTKTKTTRKKKKKKDVTTIVDDDIEFDSTNQLVVPSNSKSKNRFIAKILNKPKSPKRRCSSSSSPCSSSTRSGSSKGGCCRLIRGRRREGYGCDGGDDDDDLVSSPVSDPNDERFSLEMLRVMLETNDFCSDECNPHR